MWEVYVAFLLSFIFYFYLPKKNIVNMIQSYMVCNGTNALGCAYSKQSKTEKPACFFSGEFIMLQHYTLCYYSLSVTLPSLLLVSKTR